VALLLCLFIGIVAAYIFATVKFSVKVEEPLSVVAYPSSLELFPNMTQSFNVTVNDAASVNYLVVLDFSLNDTVFQESYVTFSDGAYTIVPGLNTLTANITISPDAPPAQVELTVGLDRTSVAQPSYDFTFFWGPNVQRFVNGTLAMKLNFTLTDERLFITAKINKTSYDVGESLGIVFDNEFDGFRVGDQGYILTPDNGSYSGVETRLGKDWFLGLMAARLPHPSPYHYCTHDNQTGYTFYVNFPRSVVPVKTQVGQAVRVHVDLFYIVEVEFAIEDPYKE